MSTMPSQLAFCLRCTAISIAALFIASAAKLSAQTTVTVSDTTHSVGSPQTVGATEVITTSGAVIVPAGANVTYIAGTTRISLQPGFHAQPGGYFRAVF